MESLRADRWLWFARLFKSRTLAAKACVANRIRLNGTVIAKTNQAVRIGDVLTFSQHRAVRVVRVTALGTRRGPTAEAQALYVDLAPPEPRQRLRPRPGLPPAERPQGAGRPTKADRRALDRLRASG